MFGRWFQRSLPVEDRVWTDAAACTRGLRADVERALDGGQAVLLLLRSLTHEADFARELALRPLSATRTSAGSGKRASLQVHVLARDAQRSADRKLLKLLTPWAPARVVFHHSLDDALLRTHAAHLQPLLKKLGLAKDEAIASPLLTRAIERAQRP